MQIKLSLKAYRVLISLLSAPGWAKDITDIYAGGKFLSRLPTLEPSDDSGDFELDMSDKQTECLRKAIKHHASQGVLPCSVPLIELMDATKIQP